MHPLTYATCIHVSMRMYPLTYAANEGRTPYQVYVCIRLRMLHAYTSACVCIRLRMLRTRDAPRIRYTYESAYVCYMHTRQHAYLSAYVCCERGTHPVSGIRTCVCMYVCMNIYTYISIYVCGYIYICLYMYVYVFVRMYMYLTYARTRSRRRSGAL